MLGVALNLGRGLYNYLLSFPRLWILSIEPFLLFILIYFEWRDHWIQQYTIFILSLYNVLRGLSRPLFLFSLATWSGWSMIQPEWNITLRQENFFTKIKLAFLSEILKKERYQPLLEELTNAPPPRRGFLTLPPGPTRWQDKTRKCFIWSLRQSFVYRLYPNNLKL